MAHLPQAKFPKAKFHVMITAAGNGSRMGTDIPKQYLPLFGRPLIEYALNTFKGSERICSVNVVLSAEDAYWDGYGFAFDSSLRVLRCGGATRSDTVLNGLHALAGHICGNDWILVHDAARPGLDNGLLDSLLDELENDPVGGLLAIPLADTLKRADADQRVASTESRERLWQAQTPQMFRYDLLIRALTASGGNPTDEAQAVEGLGYQPKLVMGSLQNLKITYPQDLALAEAIFNMKRMKNTHD